MFRYARAGHWSGRVLLIHGGAEDAGDVWMGSAEAFAGRARVPGDLVRPAVAPAAAPPSRLARWRRRSARRRCFWRSCESPGRRGRHRDRFSSGAVVALALAARHPAFGRR